MGTYYINLENDVMTVTGVRTIEQEGYYTTFKDNSFNIMLKLRTSDIVMIVNKKDVTAERIKSKEYRLDDNS